MGVTRLAGICRTLIRLGKPGATPAALIEAGTLASQRTVAATLDDLPARVSESGLDVYVYCDNDAKVRAPFDAMHLLAWTGTKNVT